MSFTPSCPGTYGAGPLLIERPQVRPWRFGLMSVATVIDMPSDGPLSHARNGIVYKSPPCTADVLPWDDTCPPGQPATKAPTDLDRNGIVRGCPFHLYAALSCKTTTLAAMTEEVQVIFNLGEQRAVEEQVWTRVLAQPTTVVLNASSAPADAFTVIGGIAALESHMAQCYGGEATIWADRGMGAFLAQHRQLHYCPPDGACAPYLPNDETGDPQVPHIQTELGTKIGFMGGSPNTAPDGTPAPSGYAWMYATSDLTLRRWPVEILPNDVDQRLRYNPLTNEPYVVCERTYVPSIECCAAAVLVCLACQ